MNVFVCWSSCCTIQYVKQIQILSYLNVRSFSIIGVQPLLVLVLDYGFRLFNIIIVEMVLR